MIEGTLCVLTYREKLLFLVNNVQSRTINITYCCNFATKETLQPITVVSDGGRREGGLFRGMTWRNRRNHRLYTERRKMQKLVSH